MNGQRIATSSDHDRFSILRSNCAVKHWLLCMLLCCVSGSCLAESAASPMLTAPLDLSFTAVPSPVFDAGTFDASRMARLRYHPQLRVNGWQLGSHTYVGQARVGGQWGLGLLIDRGDNVFGVNHRGVQWLKRF